MKTIILLSLLASSMAFAQNEYRVPVSKELKKYASFKIDQSEVETTNGILELTYDLPKELVGKKKTTISLAGSPSPKDGLIALSGKKGDALCKESKTKALICSVAMRDLNIDSRSVKEVLEEISTSSEELSSRLLVAEQFRGEPAGIVIYRD